MDVLEKHFRLAKDAGLGVTLHIAEVRSSSLAACLHLPHARSTDQAEYAGRHAEVALVRAGPSWPCYVPRSDGERLREEQQDLRRDLPLIQPTLQDGRETG